MVGVLMLVYGLHQGGGTETHVLTLAKRLLRQGYRVGVYTAGGGWVEHFQSNGVETHVCEYNIHSLQDIINRYEYRIVHAHEPTGYTLVRELKRKTQMPAVLTVHGRYVHPKTMFEAAESADAIITVSEECKRYLREVCHVTHKRIQVIPNGVSTYSFRSNAKSNFRNQFGIPTNAFVIGYSGRFTFDKIDLGKRIYKIAHSYAKKHPGIHVIVVGRGSTQHLALRSNATILDYVSKMRNFYTACDLVIGTGRTAIESLLCGTPTIVVGNRKYIGLMTMKKLHLAQSTNFGDHRVTQVPWNNNQLLRDIEYVYRHTDVYKKSIEHVRRAMRPYYSASRMTKKITNIYANLL